MPPFTLRRTLLTAQGFTEPLEGLGDAIPLDMLLIRGGTFTMGSPFDEPDRNDDEGPQHEVTVPTFLMGRYPITQAQWRIVAGLPQVNRQLDLDPAYYKGSNRPVENVDWYEAVEFCDRLACHSGRPYRLSSEAEWEYACRAGTDTPFSFGKTLTPELANYDGDETYNGGPEGEYRQETTPVDHFEVANAWGLCDMHGNIFEWCLDHWHNTYEGAPKDGSAWLTDKEETGRIIRGGSWYYDPRYCRSAYRFNTYPVDRSFIIGFRVVCRAPRTLQDLAS